MNDLFMIGKLPGMNVFSSINVNLFVLLLDIIIKEIEERYKRFFLRGNEIKTEEYAF